jgi:hypothetical protein
MSRREVSAMLTHDKNISGKTLFNQFSELPPDARQEVLSFIEFLHIKYGVNQPHRGIKGLWANEGFTITDDEIAEARSECWGNFPREDIL